MVICGGAGASPPLAARVVVDFLLNRRGTSLDSIIDAFVRPL